MLQTCAKRSMSVHDWVKEGIYCESCKKLKFDITTKYNLNKTESVNGNEMYQIPWDLHVKIHV